MAGKRIRCVCGTVYDPTALPNCPACGAASVSAPASQPGVNDKAGASAAAGGPQNTSRDGVAIASQGVLQRHATLIAVIAGVAVLALLALLVRPNADTRSNANAAAPAGRPIVANDAVDPADPSVPESSNEPAAVDPRPAEVLPKPAPRRPIPAPPASDLAKFAGEWTLLTARMQPEAVIPGLPITRSILAQTVTAAFAGTGAVSTLRIAESGSYVLNVDVTGDGQFTSNITPDKHLLSVAAQGTLVFSPSGVEVTDRVRVMLKPVRFDMPQMDVKANDTEMSLLPFGASGGATSTWFRPGDSGLEHGQVTGTWAYPQVFVDSYMPYRGTLELQDAGNYRVRFTRTEQGLLTAAGGDYEFKRSINMGPPVAGRYEFEGDNRFTLTEPRGTATWVRAAGTARPPTGGRPPARGTRK